MDTTPSELQAPPIYTDDPQPWRKLAAAIVEQAVRDYRAVVAHGGLETMRKLAAQRRGQPAKGAPKCRAGRLDDAISAVSFIEGKACEELCGFVGVEVAGVRNQLRREAAEHLSAAGA